MAKSGKSGTATAPKSHKREAAGAAAAALEGSHLKAAERSGKTAADILRDLEAAESAAFEKFQAEQRERREKALGDVLDPLKSERSKLAQTVNEANQRIAEIDKEIAKLTGTKAAPERGERKRRTRLNDEQKLEKGRAVFDFMSKSKGNDFKPSDLDGFSAPLKPREAIDVWNSKGADGNGQKIHKKGDKATTRYYLPA